MGKACSWPEIQRGTASLSLFPQGPFKAPFLFFSQLGAVRFDRDLRAITTYLSSQTAFGDVREKFVRLQQIATLLNLDQVRVFSLFFLCVGGLE
jgi:hypothetical protein